MPRTPLALVALAALPLLGCPSGNPPAEPAADEGSAPAEEAAPAVDEAAAPTEAAAVAAVDDEAGEGTADGSGEAADPRALQLQPPQFQLNPSQLRAPGGGLQLRGQGDPRIRPATPQPVQRPRLQLQGQGQ